MNLHLVDNWQHAWKWVSVNCMAVAGGIQGTWMCMSDDMRSTVPHWAVEGLTIAILIFGIIGRVVRRGEKDDVGP